MGNNVDFLNKLKTLLQLGLWSDVDELCDNKLNEDAHCAEAYLGQLMAAHKISEIEDLYTVPDLKNNPKFKRVMTYASEELKEQIASSIGENRIIQNNDCANTIYNQCSQNNNRQKSNVSHTVQNTNTASNVDLEADFIDENAEYYQKSFDNMRFFKRIYDWNWSAFFFGVPWFVYRKMYKLSGWLFAIWVVFVILTNHEMRGPELFTGWGDGDWFIFYIWYNTGTIIFNFLAGIFANYFYMRHVEKNIKVLSSLPMERKDDFIRYNGGVDVRGIIGGVILLVFLHGAHFFAVLSDVYRLIFPRGW